MKTWKIYRLLNTVTGKSYFGATGRNLRQRWSKHVSDAKKGRGCAELSKAILEYGAASFEVTTVCTVATAAEADAMERSLIALHNTQWPNGYNLFDGGRKGFHVPPEVRAKMSLSQTGRKRSALTKARLAATKIGEKNPSAKLTAEKVAQIRALAQAGVGPHRKIADMFGVCPATIGMLLRGQTWTH